jgi:hypothetical protein
MPRALFPSIAHDVYGGGPRTAGALYSALAAGALLGALFGGWLGRIHRQGLAVLVAIVAWGLAITAFGLSGVFIAVVAGGPRLGDGLAGLSSELMGLKGAVVSGGLAVVALTAVCAAAVPRFRAYDVREPTA